MTETGRLDAVDVLKTGHHGSRYATSESFLQYIKPQYAVISCGKKNRYGHPHKETLERLQDAGAEVYRTDSSGAVIADTDRKNYASWVRRIKLSIDTKPQMK